MDIPGAGAAGVAEYSVPAAKHAHSRSRPRKRVVCCPAVGMILTTRSPTDPSASPHPPALPHTTRRHLGAGPARQAAPDGRRRWRRGRRAAAGGAGGRRKRPGGAPAERALLHGLDDRQDGADQGGAAGGSWLAWGLLAWMGTSRNRCLCCMCWSLVGGSLSVVERQIVENPTPNCTCLTTFPTQGHTEVIRVLLEAGADAGVRDDDYWTALHWAANNGEDSGAATS